MDGETKTSPWVYVGIGCTAIVVLGIVAVGAIGFLGYRWAKQVEHDTKDPAAREAKVMEVLGSERLPEGYHPMLSLSLPFVMDMAMLSDRAPDANGQIHGFDERGFLYFRLLNPAFKGKEMRDYFEGKTDDPSVLTRSGINLHLHSRQILRRGVFEAKDYPVMFLAQRGRLDMDQVRTNGINALMLVDCPRDARMRMAIWFGPDPDPKATAESASLAGTPADEAALREFMGHFSLCRGAP
jgi:hypothetical protein